MNAALTVIGTFDKEKQYSAKLYCFVLYMLLLLDR